MLHAVVEHFVVDFIGINNELVFARHLDNLFQHLFGIDGSSGVIRVNQHNRAGFWRDLAANVFNIWEPARLLIAHIMPRRATRQGDRRRPQRIIRRRHQHLIIVVQQRLHGHHDQLRHPIADVNILDFHPAYALGLGVVHDGFACGKQPLGIRITRGAAQVQNHVLHDFFRRFKAERRGVADIQLDDAVSFLLHLLRSRHHRPANVVADIGQFGRFAHRVELGIGHDDHTVFCYRKAGNIRTQPLNCQTAQKQSPKTKT